MRADTAFLTCTRVMGVRGDRVLLFREHSLRSKGHSTSYAVSAEKALGSKGWSLQVEGAVRVVMVQLLP